MKAIIKHERGVGLKLVERPKPEYGINDVLIKISKTSTCGTDVHIYNWDMAIAAFCEVKNEMGI